ncbi:MAG: hypothetical protein AB8C95_09560 [Phycisphaeraceae bacterium]
MKMLRFAVVLGLIVFASAHGVSAQALSDAQRDAVVAWLEQDAAERNAPAGLDLPQGLSAEASAEMLDALWSIYRETVKDPELIALPPTMAELAKQAEDGRLQIRASVLTLGEHKMPYAVIRREKQPINAGDRPLFICTHGGGARPSVESAHAWNVNAREWQTQVRFAIQHYPEDGVYFVPRMADDRLGRWWHRHNHDAFERVIEHAIAQWGVDPNRVYKVGISEGGYGTDILAPFMPDRFAGANAMAAGVDQSNPPENLRNLAFRTDVGEKDTMFDRVTLAKAFHQTLDELHKADPTGYTHSINVQPGRGHGIDYRPGVTWIAKHKRNAWPSRLTWLGKSLHDRRRDRHYWIQIEGDLGTDAVKIDTTADRETNTITIDAKRQTIEGDGGNPTHAKVGSVKNSEPLKGVTLRVLLHDELLDLDQPIKVIVNGETLHDGKVTRNTTPQLRTMSRYGDPAMTASAELVFALGK